MLAAAGRSRLVRRPTGPAKLASAGAPLLAACRDPLALLRGLRAIWGIVTTGWKSSSGQQDGFSSSGPYRFTRNPQYLRDNVLFLGPSIIATSRLVWITWALFALVFIITLLSKEVWLKEQYGKECER